MNYSFYRVNDGRLDITSALLFLPNGKTGNLDFVTKLKNLRLSGHFKMLSLDIESLFPSIPLDETIGIATECFFKNILDKI